MMPRRSRRLNLPCLLDGLSDDLVLRLFARTVVWLAVLAVGITLLALYTWGRPLAARSARSLRASPLADRARDLRRSTTSSLPRPFLQNSE